MSRTFYSYAVSFTLVFILMSLFQSALYFGLSARAFELPSVKPWLLCAYLFMVAWSLILARYYYDKRYVFSFWMIMASVIASFFQFVIFYRILLTRELSSAYIVATAVGLALSIVYSIGLIFSEAGKRRWLKTAGIFNLGVQLATTSSFILAATSVSVRLDGTSEQIEQWLTLISSVGFAFFLLNFIQEKKNAASERSPSEGMLLNVMGIGLVAVIASGIFFVPKLIMEGVALSDNPDHVSDFVQMAAKRYEAGVYVSKTGETLPYRLMKPVDYDSTKKYPLVVCLHGSSGCGIDNAKQVLTALPAQMLSADSIRKKYPSILLVPQCPQRSSWGGIGSLPSVDSLVVELLLFVQNELGVDKDRCYIMGNSMGGYGTWHLVGSHPELFAAAVPICGGGDPSIAEKIKGIPIWAFHGAKDRNVPVSGSRDIIDAIKNAGGNPRYTEYPEAAHNISKQVTENEELLKWVFSQSKVTLNNVNDIE
jgi:pimeloyl-ACP methyl ester carboxylesterase